MLSVLARTLFVTAYFFLMEEKLLVIENLSIKLVAYVPTLLTKLSQFGTAFKINCSWAAIYEIHRAATWSQRSKKRNGILRIVAKTREWGTRGWKPNCRIHSVWRMQNLVNYQFGKLNCIAPKFFHFRIKKKLESGPTI